MLWPNEEARVRRLAGWIVVAVLAVGCSEAADDTASAQPAPVAPVEVTGTTPAAPDEVATLRARVAELEQQLATCQGAQAPSGTQTAAVPAEGATIPEGVDVPAQEPAPATTTTQTATRDAGTRARRRGDPDLIDTILGPDGRRRRRGDDETIELPNPANILLGE